MPTPLLSAEQIDTLAEEIAKFAAHIDVATHALLTRLRIFDAHDAWANTGFLSTAQWLSWRTHLGINAAREKVRVARALGELPRLDAMFSRAELSYSKVRAITRVATPANEQHFIDVAEYATASQIERLTRAYKRCSELAEVPSELRDERRFVRRSETPSGMIRIEMQLPPEEAAVVWQAIESADDQRARPEVSAETSAEVCPEEPGTNAVKVSAEVPERRADAVVDLARAYLKHQPRTLGSAYELVVLTTKRLLERGEDGVGGFMRDGTPVPLEVVRRMASDGAHLEVIVGEHGEVLDVGRRTRTIPPAIGRALWLRDGGCRVPGCGRKRHLHGHHIEGWAEGGPTALANLVLVCSGHHRMIHEGGLSCEVDDGKLTFRDCRGRSIPAAPPSAASGADLDELELFLREADLLIDPSLTTPKWDGTRMNLGEALSWMFMAA